MCRSRTPHQTRTARSDNQTNSARVRGVAATGVGLRACRRPCRPSRAGCTQLRIEEWASASGLGARFADSRDDRSIRTLRQRDRSAGGPECRSDNRTDPAADNHRRSNSRTGYISQTRSRRPWNMGAAARIRSGKCSLLEPWHIHTCLAQATDHKNLDTTATNDPQSRVAASVSAWE